MKIFNPFKSISKRKARQLRKELSMHSEFDKMQQECADVDYIARLENEANRLFIEWLDAPLEQYELPAEITFKYAPKMFIPIISPMAVMREIHYFPTMKHKEIDPEQFILTRLDELINQYTK